MECCYCPESAAPNPLKAGPLMLHIAEFHSDSISLSDMKDIISAGDDLRLTLQQRLEGKVKVKPALEEEDENMNPVVVLEDVMKGEQRAEMSESSFNMEEEAELEEEPKPANLCIQEMETFENEQQPGNFEREDHKDNSLGSSEAENVSAQEPKTDPGENTEKVRVFKCGDCSKQFSRKQPAGRHVKKAHFPDRDLTREELWSHIVKAVVEDKEGRKFREYLSSVGFDNPAKNCKSCPVCQKRFASLGHVKRHIKIKHFLKKFKNQGKLMDDMFTQFMECFKKEYDFVKRDECPVCNRKFAMHSNTLRHIKNVHYLSKKLKPRKKIFKDPLFGEFMGAFEAKFPHRDVKDCPECKRTFASSAHACRHIKLRHYLGKRPCPTKKIFKDPFFGEFMKKFEAKFPRRDAKSCQECNLTYSTSTHANRHIKLVHYLGRKPRPKSNPYKDPMFGEFMKSFKAKFPQHNTDECPQCHAKFATPHNVTRHIKNVHYLGRKSHTVTKTYKAKDPFFVEFMRGFKVKFPQHSPGECPECHAKFATAHNVTRHIKNVHYLGRKSHSRVI